MELYTFLMDYLGGTYISQVRAENISDAMRLWVRALKPEEIEGLSQQDKDDIIKTDFIDENPMLIQGLKNVWHFLILTKEGPGYINFVKTSI